MKTDSDAPLLIVGGDADPNIQVLLAAARRCQKAFVHLLVGKESHPALRWEVATGELLLDGKPLECSAAFIRHDVFTALSDGQPSSHYRALAWYTALTGWLSAHPSIQIFNRRNLNQITNKPLVLHQAQSVGLAIPQTLVTNDFDYLAQYEPEQRKIVKPINGGGYCQDLQEVAGQTTLRNGRAAAPAIVQHMLVAPEVRIYAIGQNYFGFNVISDELDYRITPDCRVESINSIPSKLTSALGRLMDMMGLDFGAADFKTCPDTGQLVFLEINNGPMFAAFDRASNGRLTDAMISFLTTRRKKDS
jgi:hypothetical protein